ncbi:MAG: FG-GAP repeat protein, partial [Planctomycetota bacterium]|nr:FG-GAP repeat protein [Planctomycetota bacterium]
MSYKQKFWAPLHLAATLSICAVLPSQGVTGASSVRPAVVPEGLTAGEWSSIRAAYQADRHAVLAIDGGHQAYNPGQRWQTRFDDRGCLVRPRSDRWTWGLELKCYGFRGKERLTTTPSKVSAVGGRMSYRWDAILEEWFVNDRRGLEHGFTVYQRPPRGDDDTSRLTFSLAVRGNLSMDLDGNGRGIRFLDSNGATTLTYTGLTVFDADGQDLHARFSRSGDLLCLSVDERGARYPLTIDPLVQQGYLKAHNTEMNDFFGCAVAVSGDTVVIGACGEDSKATGVNGDRNDNSRPESGAAYVFVRSGTAWESQSWSQQAYIKASNPEAGDHFGSAVAVSGDVVVIGAYGEDSDADGVNGNQFDNGARNSGAAYVFKRKGTSWCQLAYLKASNSDADDRFGYSVAIDGDTAVIGAWGESSDATGINGNTASNSRSKSGAAYVFIQGGSSWFLSQQQAYLKASNTGTGDYFGHAVSISGNTVLAGAPGEDSKSSGPNGNQSDNNAGSAGAVYAFVRNGANWSQQSYLKASNTDRDDFFGSAVAIDGDTLVIGAHGEDGDNTIPKNNGATFAGAAYVFSRTGGVWNEKKYLKATNTNWGDRFGYSVAISGDSILIGAPEEDSRATGING